MGFPQDAQTQLIRVLCEFCSPQGNSVLTGDEECGVCEGHRYYRWNPETHLCYSADGDPIFVSGENGKEQHLTRRPPPAANHLSVEDMLTVMGAWVAQAKTRKFKLWFENGWHCYLWPNKHKPELLSYSDPLVHVCVRDCYEQFILRYHR